VRASVGRQLAEPSRIGSKEVENHEGLATGLREGIGLAIDYTNQMRLRQNSVNMCA
jgi:hypothetical protein